jgi:tellurite methyltransferase
MRSDAGGVAAAVRRTIVGFEQDASGDWVAELSCGHRQHIRHRPPFEVRPWVLDAGARDAKIGTLRDCPLCHESESADRADSPAGDSFI